MRIVFMGSPEPAIHPLRSLMEAVTKGEHQLVGIISQPARPVGRKQILQDPPIAAFAKEAGLPLFQPKSVNTPEFLDQFRALQPDVAVTAAFGQILSSGFLGIPKRGTINIHPSLLPLYRGATPVPSALLHGDQVTGVSILFTVKALDAGAIIDQVSVPIEPEETAEALLQRLFSLGGERLLVALEALKDPTYVGVPQNENQVTHCHKISKEDGQINWIRKASEIYNQFRAYTPWPGVATFWEQKRIGLTEIKRVSGAAALDLRPGQLALLRDDKKLVVGTGDGLIEVVTLLPAGGKPMTGFSFWNGLKNKENVTFETRPI